MTRPTNQEAPPRAPAPPASRTPAPVPTPDADAAIRAALKQVRAAQQRLEQHDQTPRPLRFLALHHLAVADQILADHLDDAYRLAGTDPYQEPTT